MFPNEAGKASAQRQLEPQVVRHDAAPVRHRHRDDVPSVRHARLFAAEDDHLVPLRESAKELLEIRPDPAPDPTVLRGGDCDLRVPSPSTPNFDSRRAASTSRALRRSSEDTRRGGI